MRTFVTLKGTWYYPYLELGKHTRACKGNPLPFTWTANNNNNNKYENVKIFTMVKDNM